MPTIDDFDLLNKLNRLLPIRIELEKLGGCGNEKLLLTDKNDVTVNIQGVSALRILALLRNRGYPETHDQTHCGESIIIIRSIPPPPKYAQATARFF